MQKLRLADEFFLINHDHLTGRPAIRRDLLGSGLVAALLAELVIDGRLAMDEGRVSVLDPSSHGDDATDFLVTTLSAQRACHPVRTWTENLDDTAYELIARRLVERDTVHRVRPRRLLGPRRDLFPAAKREAVEPLLRLDAVIRNPIGADVHRAVSVVLVVAAGAEHVLATDLDRDRVRTGVAELANGLPADLKELVGGFEAAVAALLLSIRR